VANHWRKTGLDSIPANLSRLSDVPAPGPCFPPQSSSDPLGLLSRRQVPGAHHMFAQNHMVAIGYWLGSPLPLGNLFRKGRRIALCAFRRMVSGFTEYPKVPAASGLHLFEDGTAPGKRYSIDQC